MGEQLVSSPGTRGQPTLAINVVISYFTDYLVQVLLVSLPQTCSEWDFGKLSLPDESLSNGFPLHTWKNIHSLDSNSQGPTGFGSWPPLCSHYHPLLVGSSSAAMANGSSTLPSSVPRQLCSPSRSFFPNYHHYAILSCKHPLNFHLHYTFPYLCKPT